MGSTAAIRTYQQPDAVVFLKTKEAFGGLSNMASGYPLLVNGIRILSSEALYQACRFPSLPDVQRLVIQQTSPMTAKMVSKPYRAQSRPDWERVRVKIMRWCLRVKLAQHRQAFGKLLLETGDLPIVEKSFKDEYWGAKPTYADTLVGMNVLGRLLMELREELKSGEFDAKAFLETPAIPDFLLDGKPIEPITMNQKAFTLSLQPTLFDPMPTTAPETTLATTMKTFPKYETYKDSGIEWLGEIPAHWNLIRIKNAALINPSLSVKGFELNNYACFLPMEKVESSGLVDYSLQKPIKELRRGFTSFRRNDVIIAKITPCFENGKGAFLHSMPTDIGFGSTEFHVLRCLKGFDSSFLYYLSKTHFFMDVGEQLMIGSAGQKRVPTDFLVNFLFAAPNFAEQTAIAHFLDQKTAQIDAAIAIKEQQIALLNERKQILIQQAVTQGLDPTVPMKDSGVEWIGEIPAHWEMKKVKHLFRMIMESSEKNNNHELLSVYTDIGVKPRRELEERGNKASTTDGYWFVKKGDIVVNKLLAWMGAIGLSEYDGVTSPAYDILRPKVEMNGYFYHFLFRSDFCSSELKRHSRGIMDMRLRLYFDKFGLVEVPYPSATEQNKIIDFLNINLIKMDEGIDLIMQQIEKLREYKTTLINSAVTGKIRVPDMAA